MRWLAALGLSSLLMASLQAAEFSEQEPNTGSIRIVPVDPTPEADQVTTEIVFPQEGEVKSGVVSVEVKIAGFPIGNMSDFPRKNEIYDDPEGQAIYLIVDDNDPIILNESLVDALDNNENYYEELLESKIPFQLDDGMHVLQTFPVRSFRESLKGDGCYNMRVFYYRLQKDNLNFDEDAPYLTYNQPLGEYTYHRRKPILLDFYLNNCQLSKDGYKVRLTIDKEAPRTLTAWVPYFLYGLQPGSHTIRLELLSPQNKRVPGIFNDVTRTITIQ